MTDEEILCHYRQRYPHISLGMAKELRRIDMKFRHLRAAADKRARGEKLPWDDAAWQGEIRQAKQRVAEHEGAPGAGRVHL